MGGERAPAEADDGEIADLLPFLTDVRCLDRLRLGVDGEDLEQRRNDRWAEA